MEINMHHSFCSHGEYNPWQTTDPDLSFSLIEFNKWSNQYGKGREFAINLIWFHFSLTFYRSIKKIPVSDDE